MDRILPPNRRWKSKIAIILAGLLLISLLYLLTGANRSGQQIKTAAGQLVIDTVRLAPFQEYIALSAVVIPAKTVYIDAAEGGRIEEIYAEDGITVQAGQPLLRLSNPQMMLEVMNREAEYSGLLNSLETLKLQASATRLNLQNSMLELELDLTRQQRETSTLEELCKAGLAAQNELTASREKLTFIKSKTALLNQSFRQTEEGFFLQQNQLKSAVLNLKNNLAVIKKLAGSLLVKAPASGQLNGFEMQIGQYKNKGEQLGVISQSTGFKLQAAVDEFYQARISPGLSASAVISGREVDLKVSKVYPVIQNSSVKIELELPFKPDSLLKNGQSVSIKLFLDQGGQALLIRRDNFYHTTGGSWIFVLAKDGQTATRRNIDIGRSNPHYFEITGGLHTGEKVIISGYEGLEQAEELILE